MSDTVLSQADIDAMLSSAPATAATGTTPVIAATPEPELLSVAILPNANVASAPVAVAVAPTASSYQAAQTDAASFAPSDNPSPAPMAVGQASSAELRALEQRVEQLERQVGAVKKQETGAFSDPGGSTWRIDAIEQRLTAIEIPRAGRTRRREQGLWSVEALFSTVPSS